jgi:hypothetical protein
MTKRNPRGAGSAFNVPGYGYVSGRKKRRLFEMAAANQGFAALVEASKRGELTQEQEEILQTILAEIRGEMLAALEDIER